ncbi:MAG TPA: hypothetical protein VIM10_03055 [Actinopolymorphaceae bacterium]|jgi:hypothetical protein
MTAESLGYVQHQGHREALVAGHHPPLVAPIVVDRPYLLAPGFKPTVTGAVTLGLEWS